MHIQKITGFILKHYSHREFDRILRIFSHEYGLISVIAKGVRRSNSRRSFHIDLLNYVSIDVSEPKTAAGGKPVLYAREITPINTFQNLKKHPVDFVTACIIARFILRTLPDHTSQQDIFLLTKNTFDALEIQGTQELTLRTYFSAALHRLGYLPKEIEGTPGTDILKKGFSYIDPEFTLYARRTLGIFPK